jgi:hypothetical protein
MAMNGVIGMIEGLIALVNDDYYHVTASGLAVNVNYTACGFVHLSSWALHCSRAASA